MTALDANAPPGMGWPRQTAILLLINLNLIPILLFPQAVFSQRVVYEFFVPGYIPWYFLPVNSLAFCFVFANFWMSARIACRHPAFLITGILQLMNTSMMSAGSLVKMYFGNELTGTDVYFGEINYILW